MADSNVISMTPNVMATAKFQRTVDDNVSAKIIVSVPAMAYVEPYTQYNDSTQTVFANGSYQLVSPGFIVLNPSDNLTTLEIDFTVYSKRPRTGGVEDAMVRILAEINDEQLKSKVKGLFEQLLLR